jgi:hypothetical protein
MPAETGTNAHITQEEILKQSQYAREPGSEELPPVPPFLGQGEVSIGPIGVARIISCVLLGKAAETVTKNIIHNLNTIAVQVSAYKLGPSGNIKEITKIEKIEANENVIEIKWAAELTENGKYLIVIVG